MHKHCATPETTNCQRPTSTQPDSAWPDAAHLLRVLVLALSAVFATLPVAACGDDDDAAGDDDDDDATGDDDDATDDDDDDDDDATVDDDDATDDDDDATDDDDDATGDDDDDATGDDDDDATGDDDDDATGDDDDDATDDDDDNDGLVSLTSSASDPGGAPIAGVEVCADFGEEPVCTVSDEAGAFTLNNLPENTDIDITLTAEGYFDIFFPIATGADDMQEGAAPMLPIEAVNGILSEADLSIDLAKAQIFVSVIDENGVGLDNATVTFDPALDGDGPVFVLGDGGVSTDGTSTASTGIALFLNTTESTANTFSVTRDGYTCDTSVLRPATAPKSFKLPTRNGSFTAAPVICRQLDL